MMLLGVFLSTTAIDTREKVDQLLDLILDALRRPDRARCHSS
ncbi:hypothetical protein [Frankia sp. AgB32]|nr:hypothetical protein [Frankia sp. AgB32]